MSRAPNECDDAGHCVTCADATELMQLDSISDDGMVGIAVDARGRRREVMLGLVTEAHAGCAVLVHAGVALLVTATPVPNDAAG